MLKVLMSQPKSPTIAKLSTKFHEIQATGGGGGGGGGITCCVPLCYNNSRRNKGLSFYVIPHHLKLRKKWLVMISRNNFIPTRSHRVCSAHFEGGKQTYMNNIPTIVPKSIKPKPVIERRTHNSRGIKRKLELSLESDQGT